MIRELAYYSNLMVGVGRLVRHARVPDSAAMLREQMARREAHFLDLARRIVFARPGHPYLEMFRMAGCAFEDLAAEVTRYGLETTLSRLAAAGVWLSHDEFKEKVPIVRAGKTIAAGPDEFLNPLVRGYAETRSSGSRSAGTATRQSTELQIYRGAYDDLVAREFGLAGRVRLQVRPILPSLMGITTSIRQSRAGRSLEKWFAAPGTGRASGHYRALTRAIVFEARSLGAAVPYPEFLPENDFSPVARWMALQKQKGRECVVNALVSPASRVASAARQAGLDISGSIFLVGGEALTSAKRNSIEAAGCKVYPSYIISEVGHIGSACSQMRCGDSVHIYQDAVAVASRVRQAPLSDVAVNSLLFTNLLPCAARFLINAEMDDAGVIEPADCRCEFAAAGMNLRIRDIFSYGKLTGQGVTLLGSDVVRVLEESLPARFGGAPGDYQLVEREDGGQTQMVLRVSPRVGAASTADVREFFLEKLGSLYGGSLAVRQWRHSGGIDVIVEEPATTGSGKVLPLQILTNHSDLNGVHAS